MPCCEVDIQYCQHERNLWRADSSDIHVKHTDNNSNIITINTVLIVLILTSHKGSNSNIITVSKVILVWILTSHKCNNSYIIIVNNVLIVWIFTSHKGNNSNIITVSKVLIVKGNNSNIITVYKSFTFITNVDLIELIFFPKEWSLLYVGLHVHIWF